jgi:predicted component of type VI protein secretion system
MAASGSVTLIMRQGPRLNQVFELTKDVYTIGREAGNDIMVEDSQISRHHARLTRQGNSYVVEDLGSTNGAFVNGRRVSAPILLSNGDMLGFADTIVFAVQVQSPMSDATVISRGSPGATAASPATAPAFAPPPPPPPPMRSAPMPQQPVYAPPPQPVYAPPPQQPVYAQPQQPMLQPPAKSNSGRYVLIGLGCLVLLAVVAVIGLVAWSFIDCASFRSIFGNIVTITC